MKKLFAVFCLVVFCCILPVNANAAKIDINKATCSQILELDEDDMLKFYAWLDGYVSAKTGNMVFDTDPMQAGLAGLEQICSASPMAKFMDILK
ncbi:HdeA family protein [Desulfovibrio sp. OttesenSCG-928-A18]|nr:HdeA family protein [Desulfovibrio sp. OttesenSCG-928-A18]